MPTIFAIWKWEEIRISFPASLTTFLDSICFFLLKGIQLSVWGTKDLNIGRSGLTNINFASLGSQVKLIDTMKYYLSSLGSLARTLVDVEKMRVEKLILQFLSQHDYFSQIWLLSGFSQKRKILHIIVSGKGVISYEEIVSIDSLIGKPENDIFFFMKDEFYSTLKWKRMKMNRNITTQNCFILSLKCEICPIWTIYTILRMWSFSVKFSRTDFKQCLKSQLSISESAIRPVN